MQSIQNTRSASKASTPANNASPFRITSNDSEIEAKVLGLLSDNAISEGLLLLGKNGGLNVKVSTGGVTKPVVEYTKGRLDIQLPRRMKSFDVCSKELRTQLATLAISETAIHALARYTATGEITGREQLARLVTLTTGREQPSDAEISSHIGKAVGLLRMSFPPRLKNAANDIEKTVKPETYPSIEAGIKAIETLTGTVPIFRALCYYQSPEVSEAEILHRVNQIASHVKKRLGTIVTPEVCFDGRHDIISETVQLLDCLAGHFESSAYDKPIPPFLKISSPNGNPARKPVSVVKNGPVSLDFGSGEGDLLFKQSVTVAHNTISASSHTTFSKTISDTRNLASLFLKMMVIDSEIRNPASVESANQLMEQFLDYVLDLPSALSYLKQHPQESIPNVIEDSMRAILCLRFHRGVNGLDNYNFLIGNDSWNSSNPDENDPAVLARAHADSYWAYIGFLAIDSYRDSELRQSVIKESLPLLVSMASRSLRVPLAVISRDVESREKASGEDIAYLREIAPRAIEDIKRLKAAADELLPLLSSDEDKNRIRKVNIEARILEQFFSELSEVEVALPPLTEKDLPEGHRFKNTLVTLLERSKEELLEKWSQEAEGIRNAIGAEFDDSCDLKILVAKFQEALALVDRAPNESSRRGMVEYVDRMLKALAVNIQAMTDYEVEYTLREAVQYANTPHPDEAIEPLLEALDALQRQEESIYTLADVVQPYRNMFDPSLPGFLRSVREHSRSKATAWFQKNPNTFTELVYALADTMTEESPPQEMRHRARQILFHRLPRSISNSVREAIRTIDTRLKTLDR